MKQGKWKKNGTGIFAEWTMQYHENSVRVEPKLETMLDENGNFHEEIKARVFLNGKRFNAIFPTMELARAVADRMARDLPVNLQKYAP